MKQHKEVIVMDEESALGKEREDFVKKTFQEESIDITKRGLSDLKKVSKGWGSELHIVNNKEYCGKILEFKKGSKFSMHFHIKKRETFFVLSGVFNLNYFDLKNAKNKTLVLKKGDTVEIPRNAPHQLICVEEGEIIEFSTPDDPNDSYRIEKGDSQL